MKFPNYNILANKPITNLVGTATDPIDLDSLLTVGTYRISGDVTTADATLQFYVSLGILGGDFFLNVIDTSGGDFKQKYGLGIMPGDSISRDYIASVWGAIYVGTYILDDGAGNVVLTGDLSVADEAYGAGRNTSLEVPTKNAVYGKIQTMGTRVTTIVSSATPTVNTDNCDAVTITALATAITSMTTNLSGTPTNFQKLIYRIKDNGTARAITRGASFEAKGVALPTTTTLGKVSTIGFIYDTVTSKWGCVAVATEA